MSSPYFHCCFWVNSFLYPNVSIVPLFVFNLNLNTGPGCELQEPKKVVLRNGQLKC